MTDHFVNRLFEGRFTDPVSHLLKTREVSRGELSPVERMMLDRKRRPFVYIVGGRGRALHRLDPSSDCPENSDVSL